MARTININAGLTEGESSYYSWLTEERCDSNPYALGCRYNGFSDARTLGHTEAQAIEWAISEVKRRFGYTNEALIVNGVLVTEGIVPSGSTEINTQKNMKGYVEITDVGLLWHITAPFRKDIHYGGPQAIPVTWLDAQGKEQIGVYQKGAWGSGTQDYALDDGSFGTADRYATAAEVKVLSSVEGKTIQVQYPKSKDSGIGTILFAAAIAVVLGYILSGGKK